LKPWIIAHRGANKKAPENTRSAFDRALTWPVDGLELDVQLTRDGQPVLYHDRTIYKINRSRKRIADYTYDQLRALDWGRWYAPDFTGEPIMTLKQTLQQYARHTRLLIEIKSRALDRKSGRSLKLVDQVLTALKAPELFTHMANLFILSFDPNVLSTAYQKTPGLNYVLTLSESDRHATSPATIMQQPRSKIKHLYGLCVKATQLSEDLAAYARDYKKKVMVYGCNQPGITNKMLSLDVDVIITDKPDWLAKYLKK
jgi:glycerophosphoryl diester phosphodiesterase